MKRIIGLDLGTTSIGWAYVNEKENENEKSSIERIGVRVNPLTVDEKTNFEKGKAITTNADRRLKRSMRRNLQRYKLRRDNLIECLISNRIISEESVLYEKGNSTTFETYRNRAKAVEEEISLDEFARVLLMINKKRGYKSNRKIKETDEGEQIDSMDIARRIYDEGITPGQILYEIYLKGKKTKLDFYRSDLQEEFHRIWEYQSAYYPSILTPIFEESLQGLNRTQTSNVFFKQGIETAKNTGKEAYSQMLQWRTLALKRQIEIEELAYVLGYINGDINNSSKRLAMMSDRSKELYFNHLTVGQYLMQRIKTNPNASLKNIIFYRQDYLDEFEIIWETQAKYHSELTPELKKEIRDIIIFYQRELKSCKHLINICELEHSEKEVEIDGKIKKIMTGSRVCPKSSPLFQEFKVWQKLNDVEVFVADSRTKKKRSSDQLLLFDELEVQQRRALTMEEKEMLYEELCIKEKLSKKEIIAMLFDNQKGLDLNFKEIDGNRTLSAFYKAIQEVISLTGNGEYDFSKMKAKEVNEIIQEIFTGLGYKTDYLQFDSYLDKKAFEKQPAYRLWHLLYSYTTDKSKTGTKALLNKISEMCGFEEEYARVFANISFKPDYGNLSSKAMKKILPEMRQGYQYSDACEKAGYNHSARSLTKEELENKEYKDKLELLKRNSLRNPVVEKILNQMINVVNELIDSYGKPDEIRIELARDLKKNQKEREQLDELIRSTTKENENIKAILEKEFKISNPSRNDIIRYKLYEELKFNGYKTLYSQTYIRKEELFGDLFDIEHIIPKARLFDDSLSNKTLELSSVNKEKGAMTAYDYVAGKNENDIEDYERRVNELFTKHAISQSKRKKLLMKESEIPNDFLERELRDSQYIAKKAREILEEIVPVVVPTIGSITNRLREDWQLVDVMKELNWNKYEQLGMTEVTADRKGNSIRRIKDWTKRNDHRHHAMDALTIAFTKPAYIQYLNNLNARSNKSGSIYAIEMKELERDERNNLRFKAPMPINEFRAEAKRQLESVLVSIKSKNKVVTQNTNKIKTREGHINKVQFTPRGPLHNETIYGKIKKYNIVMRKVDGKLDEKDILCVTNPRYREALYARFAANDNNAKKAFTGKNSLLKNPIWLDKEQTICVPTEVKTICVSNEFTIRKPIDKTLKIEKVVDQRIRDILNERLKDYGDDAGKAFSNLEDNPIWLNKEKGIQIKRVTIQAKASDESTVPLHEKLNQEGKRVLDKNGKPIPTDYVTTAGNHHAAIFIDAEGNWREHIVSFYEATVAAQLHLPIIDRDYRSEEGWKFQFSMKQNEYFIFPNEKTGFNPSEIDLKDPINYSLISPNLYRVQKFSSCDYVFRHHLETNVDKSQPLKDTTWKRIQTIKGLEGIIKVRINHIGQIVDVGEY